MITDEEIANRVRRLQRARLADRNQEAPDPPDEEASQVYRDLWSEYWSIGDGLDWILQEGLHLWV